MNQTIHPPHAATASCATCATLLQRTLGRRRLLMLGAGALAATLPTVASAQRSYEAMLLMCIDPRFVRHTNTYMDRRNLTDHYSQFALAGAAAGAVAPHWRAWHNTFWENLAASIQLHRINAVIAMNHRDCAAVKLAYGADSIATPEKETTKHREILGTFRREALRRHRDLRVETYLMALDGSVLEIT